MNMNEIQKYEYFPFYNEYSIFEYGFFHIHAFEMGHIEEQEGNTLIDLHGFFKKKLLYSTYS